VTTLNPDMAAYLALPENFSGRAEQVARDVVAQVGAATAYDKAQGLQDFFRDQGVFADDDYDWEYVLSERTGHDVDAIEAFLDTNRGYCEMYAGTYAAMARAIGVPSRVAVGFTWGESDPADPELYRVKGKYAHAWPEVWLGDEVGWIAFEPTPGRGAPAMEVYNGVTASQTDGTSEGVVGATTTTAATSSPTTPPTTAPEGEADLDDRLGTATDQPASSSDDAGLPWVVRLGIAALLLLGAVVLYVTLAAGYTALHRRRRRERAASGRASVTVAWEESLDHLGLIGIAPQRSESHTEFAERVGWALPERRDDLDQLADLTDRATYGVADPDIAEVRRADDAARAIGETVHGRVSRWQVWRHRLDPRNLTRASARSTRQTARSSRA
jgi:hypothetical protein